MEMLNHSIIFWDLDYTLIDSSIRYKSCIDEHRNLDVSAYRQTQTENHLRNDGLTPLVRVYRRAQGLGIRQYAITARHCLSCDYQWISSQGLLFARIFSRDSIHHKKASDGKPDGIYKRDILKPLINLRGFKGKSIALIDDNNSVLNEAKTLGITPYNSIELLEKHYPWFKFKAGI